MTRSQSYKKRALAFRKLAEICEALAAKHEPAKKKLTPKEKKQAMINELITRAQSGKYRGRKSKTG